MGFLIHSFPLAMFNFKTSPLLENHSGPIQFGERVTLKAPPQPQANSGLPPGSEVFLDLLHLPGGQAAVHYSVPGASQDLTPTFVPVVAQEDGELVPRPVDSPVLQALSNAMGCTFSFATGLSHGSHIAMAPTRHLHAQYAVVSVNCLGDGDYQCVGFIHGAPCRCNFKASSDNEAFFLAAFLHENARRPDFDIGAFLPGLPVQPTGPADYQVQLDAARLAFHYGDVRYRIRDIVAGWNLQQHGPVGSHVAHRLSQVVTTSDLPPGFLGTEIRNAIAVTAQQQPGDYPFGWPDLFSHFLGIYDPETALDVFSSYKQIYETHGHQRWDDRLAASVREANKKQGSSTNAGMASGSGYALASSNQPQLPSGSMDRINRRPIRMNIASKPVDPPQELNDTSDEEIDAPQDLPNSSHRFSAPGPLLAPRQATTTAAGKNQSSIASHTVKWVNQWNIGEGPVAPYVRYCLREIDKVKKYKTDYATKQRSLAIKARQLREPGDYPDNMTDLFELLIRRHGNIAAALNAINQFEGKFNDYGGNCDWATKKESLETAYRKKHPELKTLAEDQDEDDDDDGTPAVPTGVPADPRGPDSGTGRKNRQGPSSSASASQPRAKRARTDDPTP